jgi:hypothetical protein
MAGGKETPRQKMIGMMYLVLTALLALNVSKSILDAFVNIEENIQIGNITEYERGNKEKRDMAGKRVDEETMKENPQAVALYDVMESIDSLTAEKIQLLDKIKLRILQDIQEDLTPAAEKPILQPVKGVKVNVSDTKNPKITTWPKNDKGFPKYWVKPIRMNLNNVQKKDAYDEQMLIMGINESIEKPKQDAEGFAIWPAMIDYRGKLIELMCLASTKYDNEGNVYAFKDPKINKYKDVADLEKQLDVAIQKMTLLGSERSKLKEIYKKLTNNEYSPDPNGETGPLHWIGKTFDHAPAVAAIASISGLQSKILSARADALAHLNAKISGGKFSFNSVQPLVLTNGTVLGKARDTVRVMMAAFDDQNQPEVTLSGLGEVVETKNGMAYVVYNAPNSGSVNITGEIEIEGKEGKTKVPFAQEIPVVTPSSSIASPELQVLYVDYDNVIVPNMAGGRVNDLKVSGGGATRTKKSDGTYIVKVPRYTSQKVKIYFTGESNSGTSEKSDDYYYKVLAKPTPRVLTTEGPKTGMGISVGLDPSNPLRNKLEYKCSGGTVIYGSTKKQFSGSFIPGDILRAAPKGSNITVEAKAKLKGSSRVLRCPAASIKIK